MRPLEPDAPAETTSVYSTQRGYLFFYGFHVDGKQTFASLDDLSVDLIGDVVGRRVGQPRKKRSRSPDLSLAQANKKVSRKDAPTVPPANAQMSIDSQHPVQSMLDVVPEEDESSYTALSVGKALLIVQPKPPTVNSDEEGDTTTTPTPQNNPLTTPPNPSPAPPNEATSLSPLPSERKTRKYVRNAGVHPTACRLSTRCIAFLTSHLHLSLPHSPYHTSPTLPLHPLASYCTAPTVDLRLLTFPVSAEELLTYFPLSTRWYQVVVRLFAHGWKGAAIHHYIYWSRKLTVPRAVEGSTIFKQHDVARKWCDENLPGEAVKAKPSEFRPELLLKSRARLHDYYLVDLAEGVVEHPGRGALALTRAVRHAVENRDDKVLLSEVRGYVEKNGLFDLEGAEGYDCEKEDRVTAEVHVKVTRRYCKEMVREEKGEGGVTRVAGGEDKLV